MIWHHDVSVKDVMSQGRFMMMKRIDDEFGDFRVPQPRRAVRCFVQKLVHPYEGLAGGEAVGRDVTIIGECSCETPS